ncbi:hypothetical protein BJ742DRAFT_30886 [Cladochytrium replicatum]|nr:hypothetical protein BJ742DRAFT_30886 [Cladochytrium replicatum]
MDLKITETDIGGKGEEGRGPLLVNNASEGNAGKGGSTRFNTPKGTRLIATGTLVVLLLVMATVAPPRFFIFQLFDSATQAATTKVSPPQASSIPIPNCTANNTEEYIPPNSTWVLPLNVLRTLAIDVRGIAISVVSIGRTAEELELDQAQAKVAKVAVTFRLPNDEMKQQVSVVGRYRDRTATSFSLLVKSPVGSGTSDTPCIVASVSVTFPPSQNSVEEKDGQEELQRHRRLESRHRHHHHQHHHHHKGDDDGDHDEDKIINRERHKHHHHEEDHDEEDGDDSDNDDNKMKHHTTHRHHHHHHEEDDRGEDNLSEEDYVQDDLEPAFTVDGEQWLLPPGLFIDTRIITGVLLTNLTGTGITLAAFRATIGSGIIASPSLSALSVILANGIGGVLGTYSDFRAISSGVLTKGALYGTYAIKSSRLPLSITSAVQSGPIAARVSDKFKGKFLVKSGDGATFVRAPNPDDIEYDDSSSEKPVKSTFAPSKKSGTKSGGGLQRVDLQTGSGLAVLQFIEEEDANGVGAKGREFQEAADVWGDARYARWANRMGIRVGIGEGVVFDRAPHNLMDVVME